MTERTNRKDLIIETASELFIKQGYEATSIRQIADVVGVTEAALYYHFKEGKRELLQAVFICQMPNFKLVLDECRDAASLEDFLRRYEKIIKQIAPQLAPRMGWFISEFQNLSEEERNFIQLKLLAFQSGLADMIDGFVADEVKAKRIAWLLICSTLGYNQVFTNLNMASLADFDFADLISTLIDKPAKP